MIPRITRDSLMLWLPVIAAAVTYLLAAPPPTEWGYHAWLQAIAAIVAATSTKYMTSGLPGEHDPPSGSVKPGERS